MNILKRFALVLAGVAALCAPAAAQGVSITALPQVTAPSDIDLFLLEHVNGPNGQKTSKLLASDLATYIQGRIGASNTTLFSVPVELGNPISGTDPTNTTNAAINTAAFNAAFAAGPHVTCQDGKTYVVKDFYPPASATGLTGGCTLIAASTTAEGSAVLNINNNTSGGFTLDGLTIKALSAPIATTTGTVTASSTVITGITGTTGTIALGNVVSGARIPAGSVVTAIGTGTITIDQTPLSFPTGSITETIKFYHKWDAVDFNNSDGVTIRNTTLQGRNCSAGYNGSRITVINNICSAYLGRGFRFDGIAAGSNLHVKYNGNTIFGGLSSYFGIYVNAATDVHVDGNTVRGTDLHPIMLVGGDAPISNFTVDGNIIDGTLNEGLYFAGALNNGEIAFNVENLTGSIDNGISVDASGGHAIVDIGLIGNQINNPGVTGIFVGEVNSPGSIAARINIAGNHITNPNSNRDDGFEDGIQLYGNAQLVTVAGNDINNYAGAMRYQVGEVAGTDASPNSNIIGPNTGTSGSLGRVSKVGGSTQSFSPALVETAATSSQFATYIDETGLVHKAQPAFANLSGSATCAQLPARTGDVASAAGSCSTAIQPNAVTSADLRQSPALSIMGNNTAATANVVDVVGTANQVARVNVAGTAWAFGAVNLASSAAVSGALPVANGGTGQTAAGTAAANAIGAAESGANASITSLSGLSTPLSAAQGGTGDTGGAWVSTFTPVVTAGSGTLTTVSATSRYKKIGRIVILHMNISVTTNGTGAVSIVATLPFADAVTSGGYGREAALTGKMLIGTLSGSSVSIFNYDNTYPGANGASISLDCVYESTT